MDNAELKIKIGADTSGATQGIGRLRDEMGRFVASSNKTQSSVGKLSGAFSGFASGLSGLVAAGTIVALGKKIFDITASFEKLGVVLANTLGSNTLAQRAFKDIEQFAATTPFSVEEVTASFVKLANQGFVPTVKELRQLGDLAASTGKSFDQLAEAILDAQVGEFERLKEFGIRAADAGDKVRFTFKGVTTEVEKTSSAIRGYITSLGDIQGVSGATEKISKTLSGQVSNLGDAFDRLFNTIGSSGKGILNSLISGLTDLVDSLDETAKRLQLMDKFNLGESGGVFENVKEWLGLGGKTSDAVNNVEQVQRQLDSMFNDLLEARKKGINEFNNLFRGVGEVMVQDPLRKAIARGNKEEQSAIKKLYSDLGAGVIEAYGESIKKKPVETPFGKTHKDKVVKEAKETGREVSHAFLSSVDEAIKASIDISKMGLGLAVFSKEVQGVIDKNTQMNIEFQQTSDTLQNILGPAFDNVFNAILNGESIFDALSNSIKAIVGQFIAAAAKAAIFAAILSALPGGQAAGGFIGIFSKLFGGGVKAGGLGGGPQLVAVGRISGQDILLSVQRTERSNFLNG